jgi:hypothetical protein
MYCRATPLDGKPSPQRKGIRHFGVARAQAAQAAGGREAGRGRQVTAFPISPDAPAWQLEQIARWHEEQACRSDGVRHREIARRLRDRALIIEEHRPR